MNAITQFGFQFGAALVERICEDKGRVWMRLSTPKEPDLQIHVTRTGKVRIFSENGEWKEEKKGK